MRRLKKSIVSLIFFHFGVTSMLVISCGGETRLQNYVQWNKVGFFPSPIRDNGIVVIITKLEGDIVAYGLYGYDPTAGPSHYEFILNSAKTSVPMSLCLPKPTYISVGIQGLTDPKSKFDIVYDTSVTLQPLPCPTTPTTPSTTTTTKTNTTTTLPTTFILTTTDGFGIELGKNRSDSDGADTFNPRIRVVVASLAFVFIIFNNFCNDFLDILTFIRINRKSSYYYRL